MSPHQIIAVAVRLFAVWLAATTIVAAPNVYAQLLEVEFGSTSSLAVLSLMTMLVLGAAYILWRFPLTIAGGLLARSAERPAESASPDVWLAMGCSIIGLWMFAAHLPTLVMMLAFGGLREWSVTTWLPHLTGLALALWLMFGASGFRRVFWWVQNAGKGQAARDDSS
jgi:hypothetical protein